MKYLPDAILDFLVDSEHAMSSDVLIKIGFGAYQEVKDACGEIISTFPNMIEWDYQKSNRGQNFVISLDDKYKQHLREILRTGGIVAYREREFNERKRKEDRESLEKESLVASIQNSKKSLEIAEESNNIARIANRKSSISNMIALISIITSIILWRFKC